MAQKENKRKGKHPTGERSHNKKTYKEESLRLSGKDQEHVLSSRDAQQAFYPKGGTHASATRDGWNCYQLIGLAACDSNSNAECAVYT